VRTENLLNPSLCKINCPWHAVSNPLPLSISQTSAGLI
jgi:hypothetical protein